MNELFEIFEQYPEYVPYKEHDRSLVIQDWVKEQERNESLDYVLGGFYERGQFGYKLNLTLRDTLVIVLKAKCETHK